MNTTSRQQQQQQAQQKKLPRKTNTFSTAPASKADVGEFQAGYFVMPDSELSSILPSPKTNKPQRKQSSPSKTQASPSKQHNTSPQKQHNRTPSSPQKPSSSTQSGKDTSKNYDNTTSVTLNEKESSKRWAGPAFSNAPPPSSLPLPDFLFDNAAHPNDSSYTAFVPLPAPLPMYYAPNPYYTPAQLSDELRRLLHIDSSASAPVLAPIMA